jgi:predicted metal-dependent hydrolase
MEGHPEARSPRPMPVRRVKHSFSSPRYYFAGDPRVSHLMSALSAAFPEGERFFMDSIARYRKHLTDPALRQEVARFLGQEAAHTREHEAFNAWLDGLGVDTKGIERDVVVKLLSRARKAPPRVQLAVTCALEHFTSLLGEQLLEHPELLERFDPGVRALWKWHALEESEHKAVAFDVYQATGGDYTTRVVTMAVTTVLFMGAVSRMTDTLVRKDPEAQGLRRWLSAFDMTWGREGWFRRLVPGYLAYYKPSFHPWERDTTSLLRKVREELGFDPDGKETIAAVAA